MDDALDHDLAVATLGIADQITAKCHDANAGAELRPQPRGARHLGDPFASLAHLPNEGQGAAGIVRAI
jgi:hypothetical protein